MSTIKCDFCQSNNTSMVYDVKSSKIGAKIFSCNDCGLLQSKYGDKSKKHTNKSISSDADWGNIRHGKKIRLNKSIEVLDKFIDLSNITNLIDIGSNRGHFINYISSINNKCDIIAIEPDNRIIDQYAKNTRMIILPDRYENLEIHSQFDLVYCCHTLEHVDSASDLLLTIRDIVKEDGFIYIDVPSAKILSNLNNVEEFFIDKHSFHFDADVLYNYLRYLGFDILYSEDDEFNIVIICQKKSKNKKHTLDLYIENLNQNRQHLTSVSNKIHSLERKILIYGASKTYDALVRYGSLDPNSIDYLVDDYLHGYIDSIHNKQLTAMNNINISEIKTTVLLTRSSTNYIIEKLKNLGIKNIITFDELL